MDTLSHALWGRGVFGYRGYPLSSIFFGILPDLFSFGIFYFISLLFNYSKFKYGKPKLEELPNYIFDLYNVSHSLIVALVFILIAYFFLKKEFVFAMLAWPLHILIDFPFHSIEYFPTPIFWPISDFKFDGIPWSVNYIWYSNVAGIVLLYFYRYRAKKKTSL